MNQDDTQKIKNQPDWPTLHEKAKNRALQFTHEPNLDQFAKDFIIGSLAENTLRAYAFDAKIFRFWCEDRGVPYLPASPVTVANFLAAEATKSPALKASTIIRRAAAIRYVHKMADLETMPTDSAIVKKTLKGILRQKLVAPNKKASATDDIAQKMADQIDRSTLMGLRDRALILMGFAGAFRRSELVHVRLEDLEMHPKGMKVLIRKSKTDQLGKGRVKPIIRGDQYCPIAALQEWLKAANITEGFVFRGINGSFLRPSHNDPKKPDLSAQVVALIVKKYAVKLGLDPACFAGHSLRRGFITSGVRKGKRIEKLIAITHQTPRTLLNYYEDIHQFDDHAGEGLL